MEQKDNTERECLERLGRLERMVRFIFWSNILAWTVALMLAVIVLGS
ncbi:MAG: hypothetical protein ACLFPX_04580 [Candidatus Omnitrophota bacterium]